MKMLQNVYIPLQSHFLVNEKHCLESGLRMSSLNLTVVQPMKPRQVLLHSNLLSCIWPICCTESFQQSTKTTVWYDALVHSSLNIWHLCTTVRSI